MPPIMEQGGYQEDLYSQWHDPWANQQQPNKQHHSWRQQLTSADRSDPYVFPHQYQQQPPSHLQQHASGYYDSYFATNNFSG